MIAEVKWLKLLLILVLSSEFSSASVQLQGYLGDVCQSNADCVVPYSECAPYEIAGKDISVCMCGQDYKAFRGTCKERTARTKDYKTTIPSVVFTPPPPVFAVKNPDTSAQLPDWMFWLPTTQRIGRLTLLPSYPTRQFPTTTTTTSPTPASSTTSTAPTRATTTTSTTSPPSTTTNRTGAWLSPEILQQLQAAALRFLARRNQIQKIKETMTTTPVPRLGALEALLPAISPTKLGVIPLPRPNSGRRTGLGLEPVGEYQTRMTTPQKTKHRTVKIPDMPVTTTTSRPPLPISTTASIATVPSPEPSTTAPRTAATEITKPTPPDRREKTLRDLLKMILEKRLHTSDLVSTTQMPVSKLVTTELSPTTTTSLVSSLATLQPKETKITTTTTARQNETAGSLKDAPGGNLNCTLVADDSAQIRPLHRDITLRTRLRIITAATVEPPRSSRRSTSTTSGFTLREGINNATFINSIDKIIRLLEASRGVELSG